MEETSEQLNAKRRRNTTAKYLAETLWDVVDELEDEERRVKLDRALAEAGLPVDGGPPTELDSYTQSKIARILERGRRRREEAAEAAALIHF